VLEKLVLRLPRERLLLESDSPVLGPFQQERNEPANIAVGLARMAALRGEHPESLAVAVGENTARVFPALVTPLP
jgi:TatD DNase family protein